MASLQKTKVKGTYYYSIVECRRIKGKPTPVTIAYLGNIDNILKMFNKQKESKEAEYKSYSYGAVYALWKMAEKHNIIKLIDDVLPKQTRNGLSRGKSLVLAAIYRAIYPGSKNKFHQKISATSLPSIAKFNAEKLTSNHFWTQMHGIDEQMIFNSEDKIAECILNYYDVKPGKLALDYTNYFTYIDSNNTKSNIAKRGRNKQKRYDLRQYSLAIITTQELAIPLCSYVYEGNKTDVMVFPKYFDLLKKRIKHYSDVSDITLICDNGSVSKKNLKKIKSKNNKFHYICAFSLSSCKELLDISLDDYSNVTIYDSKNILCYRTDKEIWGEKRECILIYSNDLYHGQYKGLIKSIEKKKQKLTKLKEQLKNPKSKISKKAKDINAKIEKIIKGDFGDKIFEIEKTGIRIIKDIDITVNFNAIKKICTKHYGKKLLITDHNLWTTEEILESYWDQCYIEDIFRDTKNRHYFSVQPQFHWTDSNVRVHTFCCLLGLMLTSLLRKELLNSGIKISNEKLIDVLSGIREVYILTADKSSKNGFNVKKELEQMSEEQKKIWTTLENNIF